MRQLILKARQVAPRVVFPEGTHEAILRACAILVDEGIATPILLGDPDAVRESAERVGLDLGGTTVLDPVKAPRYEDYARDYFRLRGRRGVTHDMALRRVADPRYFASMMLHGGDADMMISGVASHYGESVRTVLEVIGPAPGATRISSVYMVLRPGSAFFLADCTINIDPDAATLAEIALHSARLVRSLGIEPRVAMLSFSNFGSSDHPFARKVREATRIAHERAPGLIIDGEVQPLTALDADVRRRFFPFSELPQDANVLIFPDLQSGNLALQLLQKLGETVVVGPVLMGTRLPVHLLQYGSLAEDVVNLAAIGAVEAGSRGR